MPRTLLCILFKRPSRRFSNIVVDAGDVNLRLVSPDVEVHFLATEWLRLTQATLISEATFSGTPFPPATPPRELRAAEFSLLTPQSRALASGEPLTRYKRFSRVVSGDAPSPNIYGSFSLSQTKEVPV